MKTKPKSRLLREMLETVQDIHSVGGISDAQMKDFEVGCLPPPPVKPYSAANIRRLRERSHVSLPTFAGYLGASTATVRQWEGGKTHPNGLALRLLNLIDRKGLAVFAA